VHRQLGALRQLTSTFVYSLVKFKANYDNVPFPTDITNLPSKHRLIQGGAHTPPVDNAEVTEGTVDQEEVREHQHLFGAKSKKIRSVHPPEKILAVHLCFQVSESRILRQKLEKIPRGCTHEPTAGDDHFPQHG
jgi:hypothetical protein